MNIWSWVEATQDELRETGNGRLADLIDRLPSAVLEDANDEVEAMVPEALALARSLELPWVEVFVRHWHLQATGDGYEKVPYAVETLEFSHRDAHRSCPQSVCTVQDLARAYYGADGPGYATEVLDVVEEALGRIDPSWPCYRCLISEKISALVAADRSEAALEVASAARAELAAIGNRGRPEITTDEALLRLGRYEDALDEARAVEGEKDDSFARGASQSRTEALIGLGRLSEALDELLPVDVVLGEARYQQSWAWSVERLVRRGRYSNDWRLGAVLEQMVALQVERVRAWDGVRVAGVHARLALLRGAPGTARRALARMRALAERLRDPSRAAELIADVERQLESARERDFVLPETAEAFLEAWQADKASGPEEDLERLEAAARRWPDDRHVAWARYLSLDAIGRGEEAIASLRTFAEAHVDDRDAQLMYGHTLVDLGDTDAVEAVAGRLEAIDADWLAARAAYRAGDAETALRLARAVIDADAEALDAHQLAALACESLGEFADALEHRNAVLAGLPEEDRQGAHWDRLIPATIVGDWDAVRASAKALDMELEGESGPVDERWALVRLRYDARDFALAVRTGPVTAQVLTVGLGDQPRRAGDTVVFDATPTSKPEEGKLLTFPVVHVLVEAQRRTYAFDGIYPGDDAWADLTRELEGEDGWIFDVHSGDAYEIELDGESRPAVYGGLALPDGISEQAAHARLAEITAGWEAPFTWLPLAEAAGDESTVAEQRAHTEALALY